MSNYQTPTPITSTATPINYALGVDSAGDLLVESSTGAQYIDVKGTLAPIPAHSFVYSIGGSGTAVGETQIGANFQAAEFASNGAATPINLGPGVTSSYAYGISLNGTNIVGEQTIGGINSGFLDSNGVPTSLNVPGVASGSTYALGVNDSGEAVGYYYGNGSFKGSFIYNASNGSYQEFQYPGSDSTIALAVNNNGTVIGDDTTASGAGAFTRDASGNLTQLNAAAGLGLSNVNGTYAEGINSAGQIVGVVTQPNSESGFEEYNGKYTSIAVSGAQYTTVTGINDAGEITGYSSSNGGPSTAFVDLPTQTPTITSQPPTTGPDNAPYTIAGNVLSANQVPVASETVTIDDNGKALTTATTDKNGNFTVDAALPNAGANSITAVVTDASGMQFTSSAVTYNLFKAVHDLDTTSQQVDNLFYTILNRAASSSELSTYDADLMKARRPLTESGLANDLLRTAEYRHANGHPSNTQFVQALFENATGSAPDATTLNTDVRELQHHHSRAALAVQVADSSQAVAHIGLKAA